MLYFQVLFYFGSLLLLSYHYSQLIQDIYKTGLELGSFVSILCSIFVSLRYRL